VKFVQEFDSSSLNAMHRLVLVEDDGTRIEGSFSLCIEPAFLYDEQIVGDPVPEHPTSGWISTTDCYEGEFPRVARFSTANVTTVETANVSVLSERRQVPVGEEAELEACDETFALKP